MPTRTIGTAGQNNHHYWSQIPGRTHQRCSGPAQPRLSQRLLQIVIVMDKAVRRSSSSKYMSLSLSSISSQYYGITVTR